MREIKFRAWLKKENRMIDPVIGLDFSTPYPTVQWFENEHDVLSNSVSDCFMEDCELIQSTGLEDRNGKTIWEGDLIQDNLGYGVVEYRETRAGYRVNYVDALAKWFLDYTEDEFKTIEVIGNIFMDWNLVAGS